MLETEVKGRENGLNLQQLELTLLLIKQIKQHSTVPIYIFPGNSMQVTPAADGILFLSLISGRNPEFLIGNHVHS